MTQPTWSSIVKPNVDRWRLAASLGMHVSHNSEGCAAMANIVEDMATKLDKAITLLRDRGLLEELYKDELQQQRGRTVLPPPEGS